MMIPGPAARNPIGSQAPHVPDAAPRLSRVDLRQGCVGKEQSPIAVTALCGGD
jgi:hypothetical protein